MPDCSRILKNSRFASARISRKRSYPACPGNVEVGNECGRHGLSDRVSRPKSFHPPLSPEYGNYSWPVRDLKINSPYPQDHTRPVFPLQVTSAVRGIAACMTWS